MQNPKLLALVTVLFWSFSIPLARFISLSSPYLLFSISFTCALMIFLVRAKMIYGNHLISRIRCIPVQYFLIGILGYYAIWLGNTKSFQSFDSAAETTVLNYTWLVFTVLFSRLIFIRPKKLTVDVVVRNTGILLCFIAVYILAMEGNLRGFNYANTRGILWGLSGGAAYGFFSAYSSRVPEKDHMLFLLASVATGLLLMLLTYLISTADVWTDLQGVTFQDILFAVAIGVFVDAFGYITWTRALQLASVQAMDVSRLASLVFILPMTSLVIVFVIFREAAILESYFMLALLLLLIGIWLAQRSDFISRMIKKTK